MSKPWGSGLSTLLAVYEAVRERHVHERSCVDPRTGDFRRGWLEILAQLSPLEAAMLQDVAWWGPQMERRLMQLTDVRNVI